MDAPFIVLMLLAALLLVHLVCAQYEPPKEDPLDELAIPKHGETCGYASCLPIKPGWLNVHLVPQTHSELGHGYNFYQHFTGEDPPFPKNTINMKRILDAIITQMWEDDRRRFTLSDTAYLFHWWNHRHPAVHRMMHELVRQGRLTIVGGGLSISDEASTSYHAIIDQFTYSLRKLNDTFRGCGRPLVAWAADVYGHSREFTSLMAQMGFDALFINPISYDEQAARIRRKALEFVWRGSDDLGPVSDMFTHSLFDGYWAPPGFCFSKMCSDPLLVTSSKLFSDIQDRVDKFIEGVLYRQAPNFETQNVMVIMGHRKAYSDADVWFANMEKLISYSNWRAHQKNLNVTIFYSSPPCYLSAVHDERPELETKQDDFFPYVHDKDSYTVGMYTSRPTFKYLIREAHIYLQMAKQLQITANLGPHSRMFEDFKWIMGVVQDHSVATGVLSHRVKHYYTEKLDAAITNSTEVISKAFTKLRSSRNHIPYHRCQFNVSSCVGTRYIKYSVQVYNPLGWPVTTPVRLPIYPANSKFRVYDHDGEEVKSETIKLPETILRIRDRPKADYELVFIAANVPPVGFRSYYVESHFENLKGSIRRESYYDEVEDEVNNTSKQTLWDDQDDYKYNMKVLGLQQNKNTNKRTVGHFVPVKNNAEDNGATNNIKNTIQGDEDVSESIELTTVGEEVVRLPMLRDFLQKSKVLSKQDLFDSERELLSSNELDKYEITTDVAETTTDLDIRIPFRKNTRISNSMVEPDIRVSIVRRTKKPSNRILEQPKTDLRFIYTTTEKPDIRVTAAANSDVRVDADIEVPESDIRVSTIPQTDVKIIGADIKVPVNTFKPERVESMDYEHNTESLAIVPVQIGTTRAAISYSDVWPTSESILVVPVRKATSEATETTEAYSKSAIEHWVAENIKRGETATENDLLVVNIATKREEESTTKLARRIHEMPLLYFNTNASLESNIIDTDATAKSVAPNRDIGEIVNVERFKAVTFRTEEEASSNDRATEVYTESSRSTDNVFGTTNDYMGVAPLAATRTTPAVQTNAKYFDVDDGSKLFIGNRYIRVNIDQSKRVASVFLRNGVRMNLGIQMFHYVSDDPSKFDIRTSPRRTILSPGAYIFRPIDPYIIREENNYSVRVVKTDIVDEMYVTFNNWTSLVLRVYAESPVIEVHWLVGPIPTEDGFGKEVFIRYLTDLEHEGAFYTDSSGRQTLKRVRGSRATYEPVELDPITGNLYPVNSKIYIEDLKKNIRFAVFNDRSQAGGALIEGAVDLMLHRRLLTDDIGFGAFLNETESSEPEKGIRAAGVHYLYVTKANRNRIFEKKFAKEIALAPRVLTSDHMMYTDDMRKQFYKCKNEFSALKEKLPLGVHLLSLERITKDEMLIRLENYLEKVDVKTDGVRYVPLRHIFRDIRVLWLKETLLAANIYKDQWTPTQWRRKNRFFRRFNDYYGSGNATLEEQFEQGNDELGGRGIRLAPQQIRTFIVKHEYITSV